MRKAVYPLLILLQCIYDNYYFLTKNYLLQLSKDLKLFALAFDIRIHIIVPDWTINKTDDTPLTWAIIDFSRLWITFACKVLVFQHIFHRNFESRSSPIYDYESIVSNHPSMRTQKTTLVISAQASLSVYTWFNERVPLTISKSHEVH